MAKRDSRESAFFRNRRRQRERMLERVGVGSEQGQRLLDKWWKADHATRVGAGREMFYAPEGME